MVYFFQLSLWGMKGREQRALHGNTESVEPEENESDEEQLQLVQIKNYPSFLVLSPLFFLPNGFL